MSIFTGVELKNSQGVLYRYKGAEWAKVMPSGKTGQIATRQVALELDRLASEQYYSTQPSVFNNLLLRGIRTGEIPARTKAARDWYRNIAQGEVTSSKELLSEKTRLTSKVFPGKMYFFQYWPKHEKTLPYFDTFPLIFPIEMYEDGFLGINFHYLPINLRAKLMDALYTISNNKKFDDKTKLNISYKILASASKYKIFEPTLHRYLASNIKSKFVEVYSSEWDIGLFLPVASFKKANQTKVFRDTRKKLQ